jgi:hypothetical protein
VRLPDSFRMTKIGTPLGLPRYADVHGAVGRAFRSMDRSEHYRQFAHECLEIAATAKDPEARSTLLLMAQVWLRLAEERARAVEEQSDELG